MASLNNNVLSSLDDRILNGSSFFANTFPSRCNGTMSNIFSVGLHGKGGRECRGTFRMNVVKVSFTSRNPLDGGRGTSCLFGCHCSAAKLLGLTNNAVSCRSLGFGLGFPAHDTNAFSI